MDQEFLMGRIIPFDPINWEENETHITKFIQSIERF